MSVRCMLIPSFREFGFQGVRLPAVRQPTAASLRSARTTMGISFERVTGNIGAIVHGVDVHAHNGDDVAAVVRDALHEHGVLFFHAGTPVTDDEFKAVAALFGEIYVYPYGSKNKGKLGDVGRLDFEDAKRSVETRTSAWHTDGSAQETPPFAA